MATQTVTASINADAIASGAWRSNDTLTINNGAVVTVNTHQNKYWGGITINNGKLRIENDSTTTPLVFRMGRGSGTTAPTITPASGLGSVEIQGNWIEIGVGDGTAGQEFTLPYRDHVAGIWVETFAGSNDYERWANCLYNIRAGGERMLEGFAGYGAGDKGTVFKQGINPSPNYHRVETNRTTSTASRLLVLASTEGIFPGASIVGSVAITAGTVVERVVDATTIEMSAVGSANSSVATITIYNTNECWTTDKITVGDGVHGKVVPVGAKVRVPNILLTTSYGINIGSGGSGLKINLTNGGVLIANTCLFADCLHTFTTPQTLSLTHCAFSFNQNIVKAYGIVIRDVTFSVWPQYPRLSSGRFTAGYVPATGATTGIYDFSYFSGKIDGLTIFAPIMRSNMSATTVGGMLNLSYANELSVSNLTIALARDFVASVSSGTGALNLQYVYRSTFSNIKTFGTAPLSIYASSDNVIDGVDFSLFARTDYAATQVTPNLSNLVGFDPATGGDLIDGVPYYFRLSRKFTNLSEALDPWFSGNEQCIIPYHSTNLGFFNEIGVFAGNNSVVISWDDRRPTHNSPAFEIYRSTTPGVPVRDAGTRIYTTNTVTTVTYTDSTAVNDTRYYYVLRKYYSAGVYEDSPVWGVTPKAPIVGTNYMVQSRTFSNAQWVKSGITVPPSADVPGIAAAPMYMESAERRFQVTAANATATNTVTGLTIGLTYTASVWIRFAGAADNAAPAITTTPVRLTFGTAFLDFTADDMWRQQSVTFVATATSHNFVLTFATSGNWVDVSNCMVNLGATVGTSIETTATAVTAIAFDINNLRAMDYPWANQRNAGGLLVLPTLVHGATCAGTMIAMSSVSGFTPSLENEVLHSDYTKPRIRLATTASNNKIRNVIQRGKGSPRNHVILLQGSCNDNVFENIEVDMGNTGYYSQNVQAVLLTSDCNRNIFRNIDIENNIPYETYCRPFFTDNTSEGTLVQNVRVTPTNTFVENMNNNMIIKGMGGGNSYNLDGQTAWALGNTRDGVPVTFTGVYDTHFGEFYHSDTTGALNLFFTASTSDAPPYVLTGTAAFSNTGLLYLQSPGDSITYTWPHKIMGVSGFRNIALAAYQNDLSVSNTLGTGREWLQALLVEFQIDTGTGFTAWAEATPANLSALSVSASAGFRLKLRLTARQFFNYGSQTNEFVVGETIRHVAGGGTARVAAVYDSGTTGCCVIDTVVGNWTTSTAVVRHSDSQARANIAYVNTSFALGPSFNSCIRGLQIHTTVDQTATYPTEFNTVTFTGLPSGFDAVVLQAGTNVIIEQQDALAGNSYSFTYSGAQLVDVGFIKPGYVPYYYRNLALTANDSSIPVSLTTDRNYV